MFIEGLYLHVLTVDQETKLIDAILDGRSRLAEHYFNPGV